MTFHETYTVINAELQEMLKSIRTVYLAGIYTDVCIIKSAMDLFDQDIEVIVIADACNSPHGQKHHEMAIDTLRHILGKDHIIKSSSLS